LKVADPKASNSCLDEGGSSIQFAKRVCGWSAGRPEEEPTDLKRLTQRVEIAVRDRMKGEHEVRVQRAVRAAVSEVGFLYFRCLAVNGQFAAQCQSIALLGVLSRERASAALRETTGTQSPVDRDRYDTSHEDFRSYAIQVFALKAAIEQIAKEYFDNNQVLWKSFTEQLENFIRFVNLITNKWEDPFTLHIGISIARKNVVLAIASKNHHISISI
jgi:hypothetical protein